MTNHAIKIDISAILYQEDGMWIAQCLQMDVCAQATQLSELPAKIMKNIVANVAIAQEMKRSPLEAISPAPQKFWEMFQNARNRVQPDDAPPLRGPDFISTIVPILKLAEPCPNV